MSQPRSGGPGMNYNPTYQQMGDSFMYGNGPTGAGEGNAQQSQQQMEFPGDFDFDNMPELLSCDVDEVRCGPLSLLIFSFDDVAFNNIGCLTLSYCYKLNVVSKTQFESSEGNCSNGHKTVHIAKALEFLRQQI